jgi:cation/acetate symporter
VLFVVVLWKDCTTRGAVVGGTLGLVSSVALTIVSPSVWKPLGHPAGSASFPYASPALFSMTLAFVGIRLFSITDRRRPGAAGAGGVPGAAGARRLGARASGASCPRGNARSAHAVLDESRRRRHHRSAHRARGAAAGRARP